MSGIFPPSTLTRVQRRALLNLSQVLTAYGSRLENIVKVTIYLTSMEDFLAFNRVYTEIFTNVRPIPAKTCVAVKELPFATDVQVEFVGFI